MAKITNSTRITVSTTFTVEEDELRALDALVGYGDDSFIKEFKEKLGQSYIRNHEQGLRKFFQTIREAVPGILAKVDRAREAVEPKRDG